MINIKFKAATKENRKIWKQFRETLYKDVEDEFHDEEMDLIINDSTKATYLFFEEDEKKPEGMLELSLRNVVDGCLTSPVGYIEGIFVSDKMRGKGWGKAMIEFAKKWTLSQGCSELGVDAELEETEAQNFHKKMGFEETYRIIQYKMTLK